MPDWPLGKTDARERDIWKRIWQLPQAIVWEELQWTDVIARYVRVVTMAELLDWKALSEAHQLEDRLGLTPMAMLRLRWVIGEEDEPAQAEEDEGILSIRERLKAQ